MFLNRQWTLVLKNESAHVLVPHGTSESSGTLHTPLRPVQPATTEKFIWKKTKAAVLGAVGAIHFKIGDTGKYLTIFGCIPMDMSWNKSLCNLHVGDSTKSAKDMEVGTDGCNRPIDGGQVGDKYDCSYTITNTGEAEFIVDFHCRCAACACSEGSPFKFLKNI